MKIIKSRVTIEKLPGLLLRSFNEFSIASKIQQNAMQNRYEISVLESNVWSVEIHNSTDLIASAIVCVESFPFEGEFLRMSFLSQVIVQEKFRGLGFLSEVVASVSQVDKILKCQASIVIARKAVGSMYYKYGYKGFGIFPEIKIKKDIAFSLKPDQKKLSNTLVTSFAEAYKSTYWKIPGSTVRSNARWLSILSEVKNGMYQLVYEQIGRDICYAVIKEGCVIELAFTTINVLEKFLINQGLQSVRIFKIAANHPAFEYIIELGGVYNIRPEPFEGHMIRSYDGNEKMRKFLNNNSTNCTAIYEKNDVFSIEIPELCQW